MLALGQPVQATAQGDAVLVEERLDLDLGRFVDDVFGGAHGWRGHLKIIAETARGGNTPFGKRQSRQKRMLYRGAAEGGRVRRASERVKAGSCVSFERLVPKGAAVLADTSPVSPSPKN